MTSNSRLVYSTQTGRIKPKETKTQPKPRKTDGIVRIRRETKGRKGSGVVTIDGLELAPEALKDLARDLKQLCGSGGAIKEGVIEIQGDHRATLQAELERRGYKVKLAGG